MFPVSRELSKFANEFVISRVRRLAAVAETNATGTL